jgi:hypothetical protein
MAPLNWLLGLSDIGASDCEEIREGLFSQPVNALSSLAYVAVAVVVVVLSARLPLRRGPSYVFAVCLVAVGLGSVAFHGPQPSGSRLMHDLPIVATLLFMVLHDLKIIRPRFRWTGWVLGLGTGLAAIVWAVAPDSIGVISGLLVGTLFAAEVVVFRRRLRLAPRHDQTRKYVVMTVVLVAAGALWVLGRTDSPICEPDSYFQPHGLWHITSAIVFGLWWWLAVWAEGRAMAERPTADR